MMTNQECFILFYLLSHHRSCRHHHGWFWVIHNKNNDRHLLYFMDNQEAFNHNHTHIDNTIDVNKQWHMNEMIIVRNKSGIPYCFIFIVLVDSLVNLRLSNWILRSLFMLRVVWKVKFSMEDANIII